MNGFPNVKLFRSLFAGRDDAYGLETQKGPITVREPLTDSLILEHLKGSKRIGLFLTKNNRTELSCIDLDEDNREKLSRILVALLDNNFYPYTERSKSKGYHIWTFFDEPIEAKVIRRVLLSILKASDIGGVEVFPKQDQVTPQDGLGNYIFLPLHGASIKRGRTLFLDSNLDPYEDQWGHLSRVHRTKAENIISLWEKFSQDETKPDQTHLLNEGGLDVAWYLNHYGIPFRIKKDWDRTIFQLDKCLWSSSHTTGDGKGHASIIQGRDGKLSYYCMHAHCQDRKWEDARRLISGDQPLTPFLKTNSFNLRGWGKSLIQILSEPEEPEKYLVKPIFSKGDKGFIVSSYKLGKTLFLSQLTLCLSMGISFLGFEVIKPAKVLYIRFELKERRFNERLRLMVNGLGGVQNLKIDPIFQLERGFNILNKKDFDWLLRMIEKHGAEVLLLDPLYKITSLDLRDTANAMPLIRKFDSIIKRFPELLLITAHHQRKTTGDEKDSWDSTYGPMFFFADMDFEVRIKAKHRQNPEFTFEYISNDAPVDSFIFRRNPETLLYYVSHPESDHLEEILDFVAEKKPTKTSLKDWMIANFGFSTRQAKNVIDRLIAEGRISYSGNNTRGYLTIPGEELFDSIQCSVLNKCV